MRPSLIYMYNVHYVLYQIPVELGLPTPIDWIKSLKGKEKRCSGEGMLNQRGEGEKNRESEKQERLR